jgi:hypothetical protein
MKNTTTVEIMWKGDPSARRTLRSPPYVHGRRIVQAAAVLDALAALVAERAPRSVLIVDNRGEIVAELLAGGWTVSS